MPTEHAARLFKVLSRYLGAPMGDVTIEVTGIDEFSVLVLDTPGLLTPIDGPNRISAATLTTGFAANSFLIVDSTGTHVSVFTGPLNIDGNIGS